MTILFILGIALVLLAIVLIGSALSTTTESGVTRSLAVLEAMTNAPKELSAELDKPFGDRVLAPMQQRATRHRPPDLRRRHRRADPPQARPGRQPGGLDRRPGALRQGDRRRSPAWWAAWSSR